MLFRSEGVDFAAPECKFPAGYFLIDLKRNIVHHLAWLTADLVLIINEILGTESLDCE